MLIIVSGHYRYTAGLDRCITKPPQSFGFQFNLQCNALIYIIEMI